MLAVMPATIRWLPFNKNHETFRVEVAGLPPAPVVFDVAPRSVASATVLGSGVLEVTYYEEGMAAPSR